MGWSDLCLRRTSKRLKIKRRKKRAAMSRMQLALSVSIASKAIALSTIMRN